MPLKKLLFKPGINKESTNYANEGGWYSCDKVRFRSGFPEKIGGWVQATPGNEYDGVCRSLLNWSDLSNNNLIGVGTHTNYYISAGGVYKDVTPLNRPAQTLGTDPFSVSDGSNLVTVTAIANLVQIGDQVTFSGATGTDIGGIPIAEFNTAFRIVNVIDTQTFQIETVTPATSDATGGGAAVVASYSLNVGLPVYSIGRGWGAGVWNGTNKSFSTNLEYTSGSNNVLLNAVSTTINVTSTAQFTSTGFIQIESEIISYTGKTATSFTGCVRGATISGVSTPATDHATNPVSGSATPRPIPVYQVQGLLGTTGWGQASDIAFGVGQQLRLWSHANYGEDLVLAPRGGQIYYWENNTATYPRAVLLSSLAGAYTPSEVPTQTNGVLVSDTSRFLVALGAQPFSSTTFDPLMVRWSDQENPFEWVPRATNQSGELRLSVGSFIMTGLNSRQEILIWTDAALYSMQYVGPPYVWKFTLMGDNTSIISPNAAIIVNNVAFWMGTEKFYFYNGRVDTLDCAVRKYIFEDMSFDQRFQVICGANEAYNEIWWFYVSKAEVQNATNEQRDPIVDKYVIYNHLEKIWYYGTLSRTAWLDSGLQSGPIAAFGDVTSGRLLFHESGVDDQSTDSTQPIAAFIESSDFDIDDGFDFGFVRRMLPDITFIGSTAGSAPRANLSLLPRKDSGSEYQKLTVLTPNPISATDTVIPVRDTTLFPSTGNLLIESERIAYTGKTATSFTGCTRGVINSSPAPHQAGTSIYFFDPATTAVRTQTFPVEEFTGQVFTRFRGRQMALRISSERIGTSWQLGAPRIDIRKDGRR